MSQPAVSAQIKAIEDSLGLILFERTARGMNLTSAGQRIPGSVRVLFAYLANRAEDPLLNAASSAIRPEASA